MTILNKKIEELQKEFTKVEEEKKLGDEEISQLNQSIYKLNEQILEMQRNPPVSQIKGANNDNEVSKDTSSYSLTQEKVEIDSLTKYYDLKDANIKRQADMQKLRAKLQNLQCDFKIYQTSNQIKLRNIQNKLNIGDEIDPKVDSSTRCAESGLDFTIDSDQMITE